MTRYLLYFFAMYTALSLLSFGGVFAQTLDPQKKAELEAELRKVEAEIQAHKETIQQTKQQTVSLSRDVKVLGSKVNESKSKIKAQTITINMISSDITEKEKKIVTLQKKIDKQKESVAQMLRKKNILDDITFVEFSLSNDTLSGAFEDHDFYNSLQSAIATSFQEIGTAKKETEEVKEKLEDKKAEELTVKELQMLEKEKAERAQKEKERILALTKGKEKEYTNILKEREKQAAQIRAALFTLRDGGAIPFGTALTYANNASRATGVRPALILAILMQESALGTNVGRCYLSAAKDGSGFSVTDGSPKSNVMNPKRDIEPFLEVAESLGLDPYKTRVSCSVGFGWGGAMGPSQFIASTWKLFASRIANALGATVADPWNPQHAVTATAFYLKDLGASTQKSFDEKNAACRYYSGRSCASSSAANGYGTSVLRKIADVQEKIDILQGN